MKKTLALILAMLMLLPLVVACADKTGEATTAAPDTTAAPEDTGDPTLDENGFLKDALPADLNFGGTNLTIQYWDNANVHNYDAESVGENNGAELDTEVYKRNLSVAERLGVTFTFIPGNSDTKLHSQELRTLIFSNSCDYDIIFERSQYAFNESLEGYLFDMAGQMKYIDITSPWWWDDFMAENSINTDKMYLLNGDVTLSALMGASAFYVNKDLFINHFGPMDTLYDQVRNRTWTIDDVLEYCSKIYTDDGNGTVDIEDVMGMRYSVGPLVNYMSMSSGLTYISRDADGYPVVDLDKEGVYDWCEKMYALHFEDNRTQSIQGVMSENEAFKLGKTLFFANMLSGAPGLASVDFEYGIVPHPVLRDGMEYVSAAATTNGASVVLPITVDTAKLDCISATLEALCSYSYRNVVPIYLESTLKSKYSNQTDDAEMVQIIYDTVAGSFLMITDRGNGFNGMGSFFRDSVVRGQSASFSSYWASNGPAIEAKFAKIIEMYQNPGVSFGA